MAALRRGRLGIAATSPSRAGRLRQIPAASSIARRSAAALCSVSSNSRSGTEPATIPAPVWTCAWPSLQDRAADGDRRVEVAVVAEVADRAAVQPASLALGGGDELHRPDLRGAATACRPGRPTRSASSASSSGCEPRLDVRHEVEDVAVALDLHVLADGDGARPRDPPEVVAAEVDEHHVLGPLLRVALELLGEERVLGRRRRRAAACRRSGGSSAGRPRPGGAAPGSAPTTSNVGRPDEEQVRARVDPAERAIEPDPVERAARRRIDRQVERLAPGEHDLDRLARRDRVLGDLDRVDVLVAAEAGLDRPPPARPAPPAVPAPFVRPATPRPARPRLGRDVRSSASKIAASAIR